MRVRVRLRVRVRVRLTARRVVSDEGAVGGGQAGRDLHGLEQAGAIAPRARSLEVRAPLVAALDVLEQVELDRAPALPRGRGRVGVRARGRARARGRGRTRARGLGLLPRAPPSRPHLGAPMRDVGEM